MKYNWTFLGNSITIIWIYISSINTCRITIGNFRRFYDQNILYKSSKIDCRITIAKSSLVYDKKNEHKLLYIITKTVMTCVTPTQLTYACQNIGHYLSNTILLIILSQMVRSLYVKLVKNRNTFAFISIGRFPHTSPYSPCKHCRLCIIY